MKGLIILLLITLLIIISLTIVEYSIQTDKTPISKLPALKFVKMNRDTIEYNSNLFPKHFVLNYFDSTCPLCEIELNELVNYVKLKPKTKLILASSENLEKLKQTEEFIQSKFIRSGGAIEVMHIDHSYVVKIFPDLSTPQLAFFGDSLKLFRIKQGLITSAWLNENIQWPE